MNKSLQAFRFHISGTLYYGRYYLSEFILEHEVNFAIVNIVSGHQ